MLEEFKQRANSGRLTQNYQDAKEVMEICAGCCGFIHEKNYWQRTTLTDMNGQEVEGFKHSSQWTNMFRTYGGSNDNQLSDRVMKRALRTLEGFIDSSYCWAAFKEASHTAKQIQLLQRGADWMTPLGGIKSKVSIVYICTHCKPNQGSIRSNGWYLTTRCRCGSTYLYDGRVS